MKIEDALYWQAKKLYVARMRLANETEKLLKTIFTPFLNWLSKYIK